MSPRVCGIVRNMDLTRQWRLAIFRKREADGSDNSFGLIFLNNKIHCCEPKILEIKDLMWRLLARIRLHKHGAIL
jgi:hypothetical protein